MCITSSQKKNCFANSTEILSIFIYIVCINMAWINHNRFCAKKYHKFVNGVVIFAIIRIQILQLEMK